MSTLFCECDLNRETSDCLHFNNFKSHQEY